MAAPGLGAVANLLAAQLAGAAAAAAAGGGGGAAGALDASTHGVLSRWLNLEGFPGDAIEKGKAAATVLDFFTVIAGALSPPVEIDALFIKTQPSGGDAAHGGGGFGGVADPAAEGLDGLFADVDVHEDPAYIARAAAAVRGAAEVGTIAISQFRARYHTAIVCALDAINMRLATAEATDTFGAHPCAPSVDVERLVLHSTDTTRRTFARLIAECDTRAKASGSDSGMTGDAAAFHGMQYATLLAAMGRVYVGPGDVLALATEDPRWDPALDSLYKFFTGRGPPMVGQY